MAAPAHDVGLSLNYPQWRAQQAIGERRSVFLGFGRGVGKTWFIRQQWWMQIAAWEGKLRLNALKPFRGVRVTCLMSTLVQFKDVHWAGIEAELAPDGDWGFLRGKLDRQRGHVTFPRGSWLKPFPAAAHSSKTARGMRTDILSADECDDIDCEVYDGVAVPWLSEPWSLGIELLGGTPTRGRHGLWWRSLQAGLLGERLRDGKISDDEALAMPTAEAIRQVFDGLKLNEWPEHLPQDPEQATLEVLRGYYSFHATYRDAPETVSPLAVARARATTPKATFEREWEANADAGEGLVYVFDDKFHVREPPPGLVTEPLNGMDHGWVDPGVILHGGVQGHGDDAVLWITSEHYDTETPNHVWNERAQKLPGKFWPDPSRPDRISDLRGMGLDVGETDNDILAGIARVADLLHVRKVEETGPAFQPIVRTFARLYVSPRCVNLIREFGLYRRKKLSDGTFDEKPEDKNNHAMDALRYMALGRFGRMPNHRQEEQR
jgi:hypothetical protein